MMANELTASQADKITRTARANERLAHELLPWAQPLAVKLLAAWLRKHPNVPRALNRYRALDRALLGKMKEKRH